MSELCPQWVTACHPAELWARDTKAVFMILSPFSGPEELSRQPRILYSWRWKAPPERAGAPLSYSDSPPRVLAFICFSNNMGGTVV